MKIHTVPINIRDFISSTLHMDATEIGAYWMLLMAHYQAGKNGLPNDDKTLARIARVSLKVWHKIKPTLSEKFDVNTNFWHHSTVVDVLLKMSDKSSQNSAKSIKRWETSNATALPQQCYGNAIHNTYIQDIKRKNNILTDIKKEKEKNPPDGFNEFWESFPRQRRGSKEKAQIAYQNALKRAEKKDILDGTLQYSQSDEVARGFAKGAAAWLNDDRWTNDYSAKPQQFTGGMAGISASSRQRVRDDEEALRMAKTDRIIEILTGN